MSDEPQTPPRAPLLSLRAVTKVFGAGEAAFAALKGIDLDTTSTSAWS